MKRGLRLALATAGLYAFCLLAVAGLAAIAGSGHAADDREVLVRLLEERAPALLFGAALLLAACGAAADWFCKRYPDAVTALAEQARVILDANPDHRLASGAAPALAALTAEINRLAAARGALLRDTEARAREAGARLEEERNRLGALMAELSEGVLVCNADGRILLYNEQAKSLYAAEAGALVGLGRSVFALIDREELGHALEKLQRRQRTGAPPPTTRFVTATGSGRFIKVRAAPLLDARGAPAGAVLALEDVTGLLKLDERRRDLLLAVAGTVRSSMASIRAATEGKGSERDQVAKESERVLRRLNEAMAEYAASLKMNLSLEDIRAADLLSVAGARMASDLGLAVDLDAVDEHLWLRVDSFALVQAFAFLAGRLREDYGLRSLRLAARAAGAYAEIDLGWSGAIVSTDALSLWEQEPMQSGAARTPLTLRDVLERHGAEALLQSAGPAGGKAAFIRFRVPVGEAEAAPARTLAAPLGSRPEYYDFDLFRESGLSASLHDRRLSEIACTVFDTETTGLEPSAGDEIISIGAVRIVNGRLLKNEAFEQLVDPQRAMSRASIRIHGLVPEALAGQPTIDRVLPVFHRFCEDTVLVAHNAAFDMRFLQLKEAASGVKFEQPVLDTLLLSAAVQPGQPDHKLESIAERLGVRVIGRHTALGDALVTGEIFLRLVPLLAERGIVTLGQALEVSRQTYHARLRY